MIITSPTQNLSGADRLFVAAVVLAFSLIQCATPSSPTGGPPDREGPEIVASEPETGTVNFDDDAIILHFSEFVERSSLPEALVIEPELGIEYGLDWGRKSVAIEFENSLPDSTTLIVTVGTEFSDLRNNNLGKPYKIAVSTGPEIDEGEVQGRIKDASTGETTEGQRVLLYRAPYDLANRANYIAETDTSGVVEFSYLRQGTYTAFWVDDRNRNRTWDPDQERAQPFYRLEFDLEKAGSDSLKTLFIANSDTSLPKLQGVGLFSSQRLRMRFSENIILTDSTRFSIQDTTGTPLFAADALYIEPEERYVLFAQSREPLAEEQAYQIAVQNIADEAGNTQPITRYNFTGSAQEDTTAQRIITVSGSEGIYPDEAIDITYATPITQPPVRDSLLVVQGQDVIDNWEGLSINQQYVTVAPVPSWEEGVNYEIRAWNPLTESRRPITPNIWYEADLGTINIFWSDSTSAAAQNPTQLQLRRGETVVADTTFGSQIELEGLAPVPHQLILYQDENGNGRWDFGRVVPYAKPEPYFIRNEVPVRSGFTSDLEVQFDNQ